jgi:hypothetical protein
MYRIHTDDHGITDHHLCGTDDHHGITDLCATNTTYTNTDAICWVVDHCRCCWRFSIGSWFGMVV